MAAPQEHYREALRRLREERTAEAVVLCRNALWTAAGLQRGETLTDSLARKTSIEPDLHAALWALEQAAFAPPHLVYQIIDGVDCAAA